MIHLINLIIYSIKTILILNLYGCNFLLRKIPYIGIFFAPLAILGVIYYKKTKEERIRILFTKLGPAFIKLGQLLSTRTDVIGEKLAKELTLLQDKVPPFKFSQINKILKQQFNNKIDDYFKKIIKEPIAAASIAQVHKAITVKDEVVALKILRPNIKKIFLREIKFLYSIATMLDLFSKLKRLKLTEVINTLEKTTHQELDMRFEAASADQFKENFTYDYEIFIPKIFWQLTSQNILCTQWIEGYKLNQIEELKKANLDLVKISDQLINCYLNQAYRDGYFHADMHPGNIMITKDNKIAFVDFGIMGKLSKADKAYVAQIIYGFIKKDYDYIAKMHYDAGYVPKNTDLKDFSLACRAIGQPIAGLPANQISVAKMLAYLFQVTEQYGMETQPQLILLQKTLLIIEGVACSLNPNLNMWQLAEPWLKDWAKKNLNVQNQIKSELKQFCDTIKILPEITKNIQEISSLQISNARKKANNSYQKIIYFRFGSVVSFIILNIS